MVTSNERYNKKRAYVHGASMAYIEVGRGDPIVFLHGNPTSSYVWRNVIPHVEALGRCIAPDLIGMGDSAKLPANGSDRYTFAEHRKFLDPLLNGLRVHERVTLVVHDWGSALGLDWAFRHQDAIKGIAYMEALLDSARLDDQPPEVRDTFEALRSPAGDKMVLEDNFFVERMLPWLVMRDLTEAEMAVYRRPYLEPGEGRRPTLTFPRQIPFDGQPQDVHEAIQRYMAWFPGAAIPKLFVNPNPGVITGTGDTRALCRSFSNQTEVTVPGLHFVQEDSPDEIGRALAAWLRAMPAS